MLFIFKNQVPPKKNSRQLLKKKNKLLSLPSENYTKWNKFIKENINDIVIYNKYEDNNLYYYKNKENLKVKAIFNPQNERKFDLTNVIQSIEDTFNDLSIINDDNFKILSNFNYRVELLDSDIFLILEIEENNILSENNNIDVVDYNDILHIYKNKHLLSIILNDFYYIPSKKKKWKEKKEPRILYVPEI